MSRLGRAVPHIKITRSGLGKEIMKPLNKKQILDRLDWYGRMLPMFPPSINGQWNKWAISRMSELNQMLRELQIRVPKEA